MIPQDRNISVDTFFLQFSEQKPCTFNFNASIYNLTTLGSDTKI